MRVVSISLESAMELGRAVTEARLRSGMTQDQLVAFLGVEVYTSDVKPLTPQQWLRYVESGRCTVYTTHQLETLLCFCDVQNGSRPNVERIEMKHWGIDDLKSMIAMPNDWPMTTLAPTPGLARVRTKRDKAEMLLIEVVSGEVPAVDVLKEAERQGIHKNALYEAKQKLGVLSKRVGFGKGSKVVWYLPAVATATTPATTQDTGGWKVIDW